MKNMPLTERFLEKIDVTPGCWLWTASKRPNGYGQFKVGDSPVPAHRFSYEHYFGSIPEGLQLDHLCRVRSCVNPAHLEPVTQAENIRRGESPPARNARKTHCPQGHAYQGDNLIIDGGYRRCRTCKRKRDMQSYHSKKAY